MSENLKMGWEIKTLGDIGKVSMCKRILKEQTKTSGDIPFYKIGTFGKEPDAFISKVIYEEFRKKFSFPKKGDILISASGTIGRRVRYDGKPAYFQDSNIVWIDNDEQQVLNDYLYRFYEICDWKSTKGATISRLYNDNLRQIEISFPKSLPEQKRIVAILDEAFSGIARAKEIAEKNLANSREIFLNTLDSLFIGSGSEWEETTLEKILSEQPRNGWSPPSANHSASGTPVLTLSSVTGFVFKPEMIKFTSAATDKKRHYWVKNGDLLITRSNTPQLVGHVAIANRIEEATIYPDLIMRMNVDPKKALTEFVYYQLRTTKLRSIIMGRAQGANPTMKKICKEAVQTLPIMMTTIAEQKSIIKIIDAIVIETKKLESIYIKKLIALEELKKSLLHQAFTGALTGGTAS